MSSAANSCLLLFLAQLTSLNNKNCVDRWWRVGAIHHHRDLGIGMPLAQMECLELFDLVPITIQVEERFQNGQYMTKISVYNS